MKKISLSNERLWGILIGLGMAIVVLVIGVVVIKANEDHATFYNDDGVGIDCAKIDELDSAEDIAMCLNYAYDDNKGHAVEKYQQMITEAYANGDEERVVSFSESLASNYADDEECDNAFAVFEDERASGLSAGSRLDFYVDLIDLALNCERDDKVRQYEDLADELWETSEAEIVGGEVDEQENGENNESEN